MDEISQWVIAALIGTSIALSWLGLTNPVQTLKTDLSQKAKGRKRKNKLHLVEN